MLLLQSFRVPSDIHLTHSDRRTQAFQKNNLSMHPPLPMLLNFGFLLWAYDILYHVPILKLINNLIFPYFLHYFFYLKHLLLVNKQAIQKLEFSEIHKATLLTNIIQAFINRIKLENHQSIDKNLTTHKFKMKIPKFQNLNNEKIYLNKCK